MLEILGWVLWALLALVTLSLWFGILRALSAQRPFTYATVIQAVLFALMLAIFVFVPQISKLHILWAGPVIFFVVPFVVARLSMRY